MRCGHWLLALVATSFLAGCSDEKAPPAGEAMADMALVEGNVVYRERMMLPPGAEVEVQLQDISRADAMATVLAEVRMTPETAPPYPFTIEYDPTTIDPRYTYALRATISVDDRLLFSSTGYIDPFSGNPVEVLVQRVAEPVQAPGPGLTDQHWLLESLGGEPAPPGTDGKPVYLEFDTAAQHAGGFSGCNRYSGSYSLEGKAAGPGAPLSFGMMMGTLMACESIGDLEQRYLGMLGSVTGYRLEGDRLDLLAGSEVVASFRSL